jgi:hypothetical protein
MSRLHGKDRDGPQGQNGVRVGLLLLELMELHQFSNGSPLDMRIRLKRLARLPPFTSCSCFARALGALHLKLMGVNDGIQ